MKIDICSFTRGWPTYSDSRRGRTARSNASSSATLTGATSRTPSVISLSARPPPASSDVHPPQRLADQLLGREAVGVDPAHQPLDLGRLVAEREQRLLGLALRAAVRARPGARRGG